MLKQSLVIFLSLVFIFIIHGYFIHPSSAQTSTWIDRQILTGTQIFYAMKAGGNNVHFLYGDGTVFYRRNTNQGAPGFWSTPDVALGSGFVYLEDPIAVSGQNVYAVYFRDFTKRSDWCCERDLGNMYLRRSTNGGSSWEPGEVKITPTNINFDQGAFRVAMAASGNNVHVVWMDFRDNTWDIYYRRFTDDGVNFTPSSEIKLVDGGVVQGDVIGAERPSIAVLGNTVHVAWLDGRDGCPSSPCAEVYYTRSTDNGITWPTQINHKRLTTNPLFSSRPDMDVIAPNTVIISYDQLITSTNEEVFVIRSTDNGINWTEPAQQLTNATNASTHNNLITAGNTAHVAWFDMRNPNIDVFSRSSFQSGAPNTWSLEENVSEEDPGRASVPHLGASTNYVHIVWDEGDGVRYQRKLLAQASPTPFATSTPVQNTPTPVTKKLGDVDGNNVVDIFDFNEVVGFFGRVQTNPYLDADLDKSGEVDIFDFNEVVANFEK